MIDERINFRHIRCFLEVARQQSVSLAASKLNIAQSAISRTLGELEAIVGVELLVRNRRGSHLTRAGREFHDRVAGAVTQIRLAYQLADLDAEAPQTVTLGAVPSVAATLLPQTLTAFQEQNRNVTVRVIEEHNQALLALLRSGELDFALGRLISTDTISGLAFEHLFDERIEFHVCADHPLRGADSLAIADLADWPIVVNLPGTIVRAELGRRLTAEGVCDTLELVETNSPSLARELVQDARRIWLAPSGVVGPEVSSGAMFTLDVSDWLLERPVGIWSNPSSLQSHQTQQMIDEIRARAASTYITSV